METASFRVRIVSHRVFSLARSTRTRRVSVHLLPPVRPAIHSRVATNIPNRTKHAPTPPKRSISRSTAIQPRQSGVNRSLSPRARPQTRRCLANDSPVELNRFRAFAVERHQPRRGRRRGATSFTCVWGVLRNVRRASKLTPTSMSRCARGLMSRRTSGGQVARFVKVAKWQHWKAVAR